MSVQFLKPAGLCVLMLAFGGLYSPQVQAHGGLALAEDMCKLRVGPYNMHFTGYQPDNTRNKEFCEDIPATGRTVVVLDYMEDALRPLPTEVRVIRIRAQSRIFRPSRSCTCRPRSIPTARSISNTTSTSPANSSVWSPWATSRSLYHDSRSL
jgi:hypothetical protein